MEAGLLWTAAGQVDTKLTAHIRGADGGSLASGGAAASLETRLTARHGDSGLGRFVLQGKVLFYEAVCCKSFISTCLREHGFCPSECCLLFV